MDKKSFNSGDFLNNLPKLLQAMKDVNEAGYVGVLSKEGANKIKDIITRLQFILKDSKGILISEKSRVIFNVVSILVSFDEIIMNGEQIDAFVSLLNEYQLDPEQIPLSMAKFHGGGLNFVIHDCYNITVGGVPNE